jgi:hypothetical protein
MDMRGRGARPGVTRLCAATGLKKRVTVTDALKGLENVGYLECVHRGGLNRGASEYEARLGTTGTQCTRDDQEDAGDSGSPALGTSAAPTGYLSGTSSTQDQPTKAVQPEDLSDEKFEAWAADLGQSPSGPRVVEAARRRRAS